jgi:hypothetical protein
MPVEHAQGTHIARRRPPATWDHLQVSNAQSSSCGLYAMRDLERLRRIAGEHGDAIGAYAAALLDIPLPWTTMRQLYAC